MPSRVESISAPSKRLMTEFTMKALQAQEKELEAEVVARKLEMGAAIGKGDEYHDNFQYEEASRQAEMAERRLWETRAKLSDVEIIKPRRNIDSVDIGNAIVLRYEGETEDETVTLLGPDDAGQNRGEWVSYESPLGLSLRGKRKGEAAIVELRDDIGRPVGKATINIKAILPGRF